MSAQPLSGKIALITGGSKGIGRAVALRLAKDGAMVVINYSTDASAAEEVVKNIGSDRCIAIQADAGSVSGTERLVKETVDQFGKIDILIANAAVAPNSDLERTTEEMFDRTYNVNVKGPYFLCQVNLAENLTGSADTVVESRSSHGRRISSYSRLY